MTDPRSPYRDFLTELFQDPLEPGYAEAARRRAERDGSDGGAGPARRGGRAAFLLALVVVGLMLAVAYQQVVAAEPVRAQVRADLEEQIQDRGKVAEDLEGLADELRDEVAELRDRELADPQARELRELEAAAGLARVGGDGAVVRVADAPPDVDPNTGAPVTEAEARILDLDLQRIANGLWAAGAEAIAINDRRLTSTSTIRSASGTILVDRAPVVGPYEVAAIGPDDLADRFDAAPAGQQMRQLADDFGITYEVGQSRDLSLPAGPAPDLEHATHGR